MMNNEFFVSGTLSILRQVVDEHNFNPLLLDSPSIKGVYLFTDTDQAERFALQEGKPDLEAYEMHGIGEIAEFLHKLYAKGFTNVLIDPGPKGGRYIESGNFVSQLVRSSVRPAG
jgi:hypothetical protein